MLPSLLLLPLWLAVLIADLRYRRVPAVVLAALTLVSLINWPWPWWLLAGAVLLWPWRRAAIWLAPIALVVGMLTNEPAVAAAIAAGCVGWALGWWGGADGIVLLALALRGGWPGLIGGAAAVLIAGLALMLIRRRPMYGRADRAAADRAVGAAGHERDSSGVGDAGRGGAGGSGNSVGNGAVDHGRIVNLMCTLWKSNRWAQTRITSD